MNERIEGLWWKARIGYNNQNCDPEVLEKFAELIVQECIDALWTEECHTSDLAVEDYNRNCRKIKEHFISRHNIIVVIQSRRRSKNDISTKSSS